MINTIVIKYALNIDAQSKVRSSKETLPPEAKRMFSLIELLDVVLVSFFVASLVFDLQRLINIWMI